MTWIDVNGKSLNLDFIRKIEVGQDKNSGMYRVFAVEVRHFAHPGSPEHEIFQHRSEAVVQRAYKKIMEQMDAINIARLLADGDA